MGDQASQHPREDWLAETVAIAANSVMRSHPIANYTALQHNWDICLIALQVMMLLIKLMMMAAVAPIISPSCPK